MVLCQGVTFLFFAPEQWTLLVAHYIVVVNIKTLFTLSNQKIRFQTKDGIIFNSTKYCILHSIQN